MMASRPTTRDQNKKRKAFTVAQAKRLDHLAIHTLGIPSIVLMESAGRAAAQEVLEVLKHKKQKSVCIFCGSGNNGGDGLVVARYLFNQSIKVKVFLIGDLRNLKQDPSINYQILKKLRCPVKFIRAVNAEVSQCLRRADVIVDAIFGIGLARQIEEPFKLIIEAINRSKKYVLALDVPSGLDATSGKILGVCVKAACTVTFAVMKTGFSKNSGPRYTGKVVVADIGIPKELERRV